jgi:Domain of unknown function (DUF4760)
MSSYETISTVISIFSVLISLGGLTFVGWQIRQGAANAKAADSAQDQRWAQQRREASMAFYLSTLERRDHHQRALPAPMDTSGVHNFIESARSDATKQATIRSYLSLYELLATGVNLHILDEDVIFQFANSSILAIWNSYSGWIGEQREQRAEPSVFCELEALATRIEAKLALNRTASILASAETALAQSSHSNEPPVII